MSNILVVGGAGGVGSAVIDALLARGRPVVATVLNAAEAAHVRSRYGSLVSVQIVDLLDPESARETLIALTAAHPDTDAVIVCAGLAPVGPVETTPLSTYLKTFQVNCLGTVAIYQATMPVLRKNQGRIILISTLAGRVSYSFMSAYSASKFAQESLCDNMRREAAPQGVKVSVITPAGGIKTNMVQQQLDGLERDYQALSNADKERYAYLYRGYGEMAGTTLSSTASTSAQVAAVVIQALDAAEPATRYLAADGEIVTLMIAMSDEAQDAFYADLFRDGGAFTSTRVREWQACR